MNDRSREILDIAGDILTYLSEHPDAQDTLHGIVRWWLLEQKIRHEISAVKAALSTLVDKGLVIEKRRQGVPPSYCINPNQAREAQGPVKKTSDGHIFEEGNKEA